MVAGSKLGLVLKTPTSMPPEVGARFAADITGAASLAKHLATPRYVQLFCHSAARASGRWYRQLGKRSALVAFKTDTTALHGESSIPAVARHSHTGGWEITRHIIFEPDSPDLVTIAETDIARHLSSVQSRDVTGP